MKPVLSGTKNAIAKDLQWLIENGVIKSDARQQKLEAEIPLLSPFSTHSYSDTEPFQRLIGTIRFILHHPFLTNVSKGSLPTLLIALQQAGVISGNSLDNLRKDIEKILRPYKILPEFPMRNGYFAGTGILSQQELIKVFEILQSQARSLDDPLALELYETFKQRMLQTKLINAGENIYPVRSIANSSIVDYRYLHSTALANNLSKLEQAIALPPAALRYDLGAVLTVGKFAPEMLQQAASVIKLTGSFSRIIDGVITDPFIRNWLDLLCFLLSGLPADKTIAAEVAFMFADWYRPNVQLDYPIGGSGALVDALIRGLTKHGGKLILNAHVEQVLVENNRAVGVRLRGSKEIRASKAVVSNASVWDTLKLIPEGIIPKRYVEQQQATPECDSFMHLHLGIDATRLQRNLGIHYIVVNDWDKGITAPQNVVLISIPSVLDPSLAPAGKHVIHVYTPGNEPFSIWQGMERNSEEYALLKLERAKVMWQALERIIPDIRSRCEVSLVGTPLTHARFLRRHRGSYGPDFCRRYRFISWWDYTPTWIVVLWRFNFSGDWVACCSC
ncbi:amine oxidase [Tolypothrix sp. NIES-4075]|nr:amine oxidase [Tolypothrix sp. NIES-4075]